MNKGVASLLYVAAATVVNVAVMLGMLLLLSFIAGQVLTPETNSRVRLLSFVAIVTLSVVTAYLVYHRLVKWLEKKYHISQYLGRKPQSRKPRKDGGAR